MKLKHSRDLFAYSRLRGFSLVELMVTLVIISCIISAMTPMITKKLKSQAITVGSGGGGASVEFQQDCSAWGEDCVLCMNNKCSLCSKVCPEGEYVETSTCSCKSCDIHKNCLECTLRQCNKCENGYYLNGTNCEICSIGSYCDGMVKTTCEEGKYSDSEGQLTCKTCASKTANCTACNLTTGACSACGSGYYLSGATCIQEQCGDELTAKITITSRGSSKQVCVMKFNAGNDAVNAGISRGTVFALPANITAVDALSGSCSPSNSKYCCWYGKTANQNRCTTNTVYSGCARTLCDWRAAESICSQMTYLGKTWRIPTNNEWKTLKNYYSDLQVCASEYSGNGYERCDWSYNCSGALEDECDPYDYWSLGSGNEAYMTGVSDGTEWHGPYSQDEIMEMYGLRGDKYAMPFNVRCITDL